MARKRTKVNKKSIKKQNTLVVFVEGETEENYLQYVKSLYNKSIKLNVKKKSTIKDIEEFIKKQKEQLSISDDELLLLYDLENNPMLYDKFIHNNNLVHRFTYLTQPCIEAHFLMHFNNFFAANNINMSAKEVENELKKYLPNYKKGSQFDWKQNGINKQNIDHSIKKSKEIYEGLADKFMSTVGLLIEMHFKNES